MVFIVSSKFRVLLIISKCCQIVKLKQQDIQVDVAVDVVWVEKREPWNVLNSLYVSQEKCKLVDFTHVYTITCSAVKKGHNP